MMKRRLSTLTWMLTALLTGAVFAAVPGQEEWERVLVFFLQGAIIDACRTFPWRNEFPDVYESSPALKEQTLSKWRKFLERDKGGVK